MFEAVDVWARGEGVLYRYRCFRRLADGEYCVQSRDVVTPDAHGVASQHLDGQFIELLLEEDPTVRSPTFATLQEAIADFDAHFGNDAP
jgi:hypothetical protein